MCRKCLIQVDKNDNDFILLSYGIHKYTYFIDLLKNKSIY